MIRISDFLPMQLTEKKSYLGLGHGHYGSISTDHINWIIVFSAASPVITMDCKQLMWGTGGCV